MRLLRSKPVTRETLGTERRVYRPGRPKWHNPNDFRHLDCISRGDYISRQSCSGPCDLWERAYNVYRSRLDQNLVDCGQLLVLNVSDHPLRCTHMYTTVRANLNFGSQAGSSDLSSRSVLTGYSRLAHTHAVKFFPLADYIIHTKGPRGQRRGCGGPFSAMAPSYGV